MQDENGTEVADPPAVAQFDSWTGKPSTTNQIDDAAAVEMPGVLTAGTSGGAAVQVNTAAMRQFAENLTQVMSKVDAGRDKLAAGLQVPAGAFAQAYQLRTNILGTGNSSAETSFTSGVVPVVPGSKGFLDAAYDALTTLQTNTEAIAKLFDSTEELNVSQAKELQALLQGAATAMGAATGQTVPVPSAGTGGSGTTTGGTAA